MKRIEKYRYVLRGREENVMGVVIGKMDGQVEKIFLEEEKQRILAAEKKKQEEDIIL